MKTNSRQLQTFFALLALLSLGFYLFYFINPTNNLGLIALGIMWVPGIAAIVTKLIYQKNLRQLGWGWNKWRFHIISYMLPFFLGLVVYGIVWLTGLAEFSPEQFTIDLNRKLLGLENPLSFGLSFLILSSLWMLIGCIYALGEEIGWRGFLVPELARVTNYFNTSLIIGLIWAVWHIPGILFMGYNSGVYSWYSIIFFTIMIISLSFIMTWLRLKSGSLWTAVILHGSHNLFIQGFFDSLTIERGITKYFTTEFGVGLALAYSVAAYFFWKKRSELPHISENDM